MRNLNFWVYIIEKEFIDFKVDLAYQLQVRDFLHEKENYWEYMTGYSKKYNSRLNISRPHKEKMDLPNNEIPLQLFFYSCHETLIDYIGNELNQFFKLPVYYGNYIDKITKEAELHHEFKAIKTFRKIDLSGLIKHKIN